VRAADGDARDATVETGDLERDRQWVRGRDAAAELAIAVVTPTRGIARAGESTAVALARYDRGDAPGDARNVD
jgi:hypothetical protein